MMWWKNHYTDYILGDVLARSIKHWYCHIAVVFVFSISRIFIHMQRNFNIKIKFKTFQSSESKMCFSVESKTMLCWFNSKSYLPRAPTLSRSCSKVWKTSFLIGFQMFLRCLVFFLFDEYCIACFFYTFFKF